MSRRRGVSKVVASQVEPRLAERRRSVAAAAHRRRRQRSLRLLAGLGTLMVLVALAFSPLLSVDEIRVEGLDRLDEEQVLAIAGVDPGAPMLLVDLGRVRDDLVAVPTVASAAVDREWPRRIVVRVVEERPLALVVDDRTAAVVAEGGRVLDIDRAPEEAHGESDLVRVVTDVPVERRAGEWLEGPTARVVSMVAQMSPPLLGRVDSVRLASTGSVEVKLDGGVVVLVGPPEDVPTKLLAVETVLARVVEECLAVVDVRDPMRAAVSRDEGCAAPAPTDVPTDESVDVGAPGTVEDPGAAG